MNKWRAIQPFNHFVTPQKGGYEMVEWFKALCLLRGDRSCPRIESVKCSFIYQEIMTARPTDIMTEVLEIHFQYKVYLLFFLFSLFFSGSYLNVLLCEAGEDLQVKIMLVVELTSMENDILNKDLGRRHIQQIKETHYSKFN